MQPHHTIGVRSITLPRACVVIESLSFTQYKPRELEHARTIMLDISPVHILGITMLGLAGVPANQHASWLVYFPHSHIVVKDSNSTPWPLPTTVGCSKSVSTGRCNAQACSAGWLLVKLLHAIISRLCPIYGVKTQDR